MTLPVQCSHCGFRSTTAQPPPEDETSLLTEEIRRIDETIRRLKERKANASMRLNSISSRTRNLPNELLSAIFQSAMEVHNATRSQLENPAGPGQANDTVGCSWGQYFPLHTLSAVCSHWRQVAWSTQTLWLNLNMDVHIGIPRKHGLAPYFRNAGNQLMTVVLDCSKAQQVAFVTKPLDDRESLNVLRDLIFLEHPQKIVNLQLHYPPPDWLRFLSGSFTALRRIELQWSFSSGSLPNQRVSLTGLCSLEEVVIKQVDIDIELPWKQITLLEVSYTCFQIAAQLLTSCPNLVKFSAHSLLRQSPTDLVTRLPANQVTLPHLETFLWEWQATTPHTELLHLLQTPSLRHLYWREYEHDLIEQYDQHCQALGSFFAKLPVGNFQLHLSGFGCFRRHEATRRLSTIFSNSPRLEQFDIDEYLDLNDDFDDILCDPLSTIAHMLHRAQQEGGQMLPELRQISLNVRCREGSVDSEGLVMLMDERRASGITEFRLEVPDWFRPEHWDVSDRECLRVMAQEGFKLEIFEGGKTVPWYS